MREGEEKKLRLSLTFGAFSERQILGQPPRREPATNGRGRGRGRGQWIVWLWFFIESRV